jgi:hypothetical protein
VTDVVDHLLGHQELRQLRQAPGGKPQVMIGGRNLAIFLTTPSLRQSELRRPAALYRGQRKPNPSALKSWITSRTLSSLVKAITVGDNQSLLTLMSLNAKR